MTDDRDRRLLTYIADSILLIDRYLSEGGRAAFENELLVQDAVLRRLETLAEAAGRLSAATKERHPEIPWREVYGFRNIAAHAYLDLHLERTWEIIERYLPPLLSAVQTELSRLRPRRRRNSGPAVGLPLRVPVVEISTNEERARLRRARGPSFRHR